MSEVYAEALARLPGLFAGHVALSLLALAAGLAISLPAGVFAATRPRVQAIATGATSVVQTVPSIALLALMVPILGGVIGFRPAFVALTLYSMLPVLRNTIVGLAGVPRSVREAGVAAGMTKAQLFAQVELPLALPTIVAGVRTSAVWVVGTATLATPVGATSLGDLIFSGLQTRAWPYVIVGCVSAALLAIVLDQVLRFAELYARDGRRGAGFGAAAGLAAIVISAIMAPVLMSPHGAAGGASAVFAAGPQSSLLQERPIRIGAKTFSEQFILARVIASRVEAAGGRVELVENLGSTIAYDALTTGEIDVYVEYTGTLWATVLGRDDPMPRAAMASATAAFLWEQQGVITLGELGFENAYAFAMRRDRAEALGVRSIADLALRSREVSIGADPEFFSRSEWTRTRDTYGLHAMSQRSLQSTFMYPAARDGAVDVITAYTTDARIDAFDLVLLADPAQSLPPYDAVLLLSPDAGRDGALTEALKPLVNAISPALMRQANGRVDMEGESPGQAAIWLGQRLLKSPETGAAD